jgi:hypothetical protein
MGSRLTAPRTRVGRVQEGYNAFFGLQYAQVSVRTWLRDRR